MLCAFKVLYILY